MTVAAPNSNQTQTSARAAEAHFHITPRSALLLFTLAAILLAVAGIFLHGQGSMGL